MICPWKLCEERIDKDNGYIISRSWGECDKQECPYYYSNQKEVIMEVTKTFNPSLIGMTFEESCMRVLEPK